MNINIIKKYVKYNFSKRQGAIKYIVIHDTGNKSAGADALAHYHYFNNANRNASAHYFVDNNEIIEIINPKINRAWHCGDTKKSPITNDNSIGVEMCVNMDSDFTKTFNKTVELVKYLMKEYNIPLSNVVTHNDVSGKICPYSLLKDKTNGLTFDKFKNALNQSTVLYRVCVGSYADINNARKKAEEVGGFIVEYKK